MMEGPMNLYFIENLGCDDSTHGLCEMTDFTFQQFVELVYNLNKNSQYCCMPKIYIAKVDYDMFELINPKNTGVSRENIFYNQKGEAFIWKNEEEPELNWIDLSFYVEEDKNGN